MAFVQYVAYTFKPPQLTSDDVDRFTSMSAQEFYTFIDAQLAAERTAFYAQYPIMSRILKTAAIVLPIIAVGILVSAIAAMNNWVSEPLGLMQWFLYPLLPFVAAIYLCMGYIYTRRSFIWYQREKRNYYHQLKFQIDRIQPHANSPRRDGMG